MRGGGLWQLGHSVTRGLAQTKKRVLPHRCFASETELKKTVLYDFHVANGGKMVSFAGWSMPIQYKDSIMESTVNCRENGGLFDFSHMSGLSLMGKNCIPFIEKLVVADIAGLAPGTAAFSVFTNERGGTIDDTVITKVKDNHIYLVVNAGNCSARNLEHIEYHMNAFKSKGGDVSWRIHNERSLLSLQGPLTATVLQCLTKEDLSKIYFGQFKIVDINGAQCFLTRTGYTGEDGFEISVPSDNVLDLAQGILEKSQGKVRLSGLGARDSLKLEAGLCLYGSSNMDTTPVEAGLTWAIGKRRIVEGDFLGADVILKQIEEGPPCRRVGFVSSSGPPSRKNSQIQDVNGENIGEVTSGGFSPCLKKNIAIGYVKSGNHKYCTNVEIVTRGKPYHATVTNIPFVHTKHYNPSS